MNEWDITDIETELYERNNALKLQRRYYDSLHYIDLAPINADDFYNSLKDQSRFKEPRDTSRKDSEKDSDISKLLKFKAWFSDSSISELENKKKKAVELERHYVILHAKSVNKQRENFYQGQEESHKTIDEMLHHLTQHNANEVQKYYQAVLSSDRFTLDLMETNEIYQSSITVTNYDSKLSELSCGLRIPNPEEICVIDKFLFIDNEGHITSRELKKALCRNARIRLVRAILLRTAAMVYCSDTYNNIKSVSITGYLNYFEPAFGNYQKIDAIKVKIGKEVFEQLNPKQLKLDDLFERVLKPKVALGLYDKEPYELKEVK